MSRDSPNDVSLHAFFAADLIRVGAAPESPVASQETSWLGPLCSNSEDALNRSKAERNAQPFLRTETKRDTP